MTEIVKNNILDDDKLIQKIKITFDKTDMEIFKISYEFYKISKDNNNDFFIDFDKIYKLVGFSRKDPAKRLLLKEFIKNIDYRLFHPIVEKSFGRPVEKILLNIDCFKEFCLIAATQQSKKIYKYFIKMEKIIFEYMEDQYKNHNNIIHQKDKALEDKKQLLELKDKIIEENNKELEFIQSEFNKYKNLKYDEIEKNEYLYVLSTDIANVYKIGESKDVNYRKTQLQTACVKDIQILYSYKTSNKKLLEDIVHDILNYYRCKSKREHFLCKLSYIIDILNIAGNFLDTLKSTYENISKDEILDKINDKLSNNNFIEEINIINEDNNLIKLLSLDENNLTDFEKELITDKKLLDKHINLRILLNNFNTDNSIKTICKYYLTESLKNKITKIKICYELMKILEINSLDKLNKELTDKFNDTINLFWLNENLNTIKKLFDIRTNKYNEMIYYNIYQLLITILKNLFDNQLIDTKRIQINKINYYYYLYNNSIIEQHLKIIKFISDDFIDS